MFCKLELERRIVAISPGSASSGLNDRHRHTWLEHLGLSLGLPAPIRIRAGGGGLDVAAALEGEVSTTLLFRIEIRKF